MKTGNLADKIRSSSQYSQSKSWAAWYAKILPFKAERTLKILKTYKKTDAVLLDVGCSTGLTLGFIAKEFKNTTGYDIDPGAIAVAKARFQKLGLKSKFILGNGEKIPLPANSVDIVTAIEVFEHIEKPLLLLAEIGRVLKPEGILHITTANRLWPIEPHYHLPFLSYLPPQIADLYVRITKRGQGYADIKLPTYNQFYRTAAKYFLIKDVTLEVIKDYQKYGLDKERGRAIMLAAWFIRTFGKIAVVRKILLNLSLGWLFIGRPKKKNG